MDPYENFKRKHLVQNRQIIQRNSELVRSNSDLLTKLSLLRAENLSLKGRILGLECENTGLRDRAERAERRAGGGGQADVALSGPVRSQVAAALSALEPLFASLSALQPSSPSLERSPNSTSTTPPTPAPLAGSGFRSPSPFNASPAPVASTSAASSTSGSIPPTVSSRRPRRISELQGASGEEDLSLIWERSGEMSGAVEHDDAEPPEQQGTALNTLREEEAPQPPVVTPAPSKAASASQPALPEPKHNTVRLALARRSSVSAPSAPANGPVRRSRSSSSLAANAALQDIAPTKEPEEEDLPAKTPGMKTDDYLARISARSKGLSEVLKSRPFEAQAKQEAGGMQEKQKEAPRKASVQKEKENVSSIARARQHPPSLQEFIDSSSESSDEEEPSSQASSQPASQSQEDLEVGLSRGGRARKSVNYALPKLNTKMRRPLDYVASTHAGGEGVRRKSTVAKFSVAPEDGGEPELKKERPRPELVQEESEDEEDEWAVPTPPPLSLSSAGRRPLAHKRSKSLALGLPPALQGKENEQAALVLAEKGKGKEKQRDADLLKGKENASVTSSRRHSSWA